MSETHAGNHKPNFSTTIEKFLFNFKWFLPVFYFGLCIVLIIYGYAFVKELTYLVLRLPDNPVEMRIAVLDMIDVVMIANLTKMVVTGSYNSFVNKHHGFSNENVSSGMLKIKIMTSVIVVSTIGLLRDFVTENTNIETIEKKLIIYIAFLIGAMVLCTAEYIHIKGERIESKLPHE